MFCPNCGKEMNGNEQFCNSCGCYFGVNSNAFTQPVQSVQPVQPMYNGTKNVDEKSIGLNVLSFFFPIAGLILYLVWKNDYPIKAKSCGKTALISFIISIVLPFLMVFFSAFIFAIIGASIESDVSTVTGIALMLSNII